MSEEKKILLRSVDATLIPQGTNMQLAEGDSFVITHRLGGNFTIMTENGMYRIKGIDADALGEAVTITKNSAEETHEGPPEMDSLWTVLKKVFDPEIPVNIVDLGLVYSLEINETTEGKYKVAMQMTLTAPGCGMGPAIAEDAKQYLEGVPGVHEANVEIVWDPPWDQEMITEEGKMILGLV